MSHFAYIWLRVTAWRAAAEKQPQRIMLPPPCFITGFDFCQSYSGALDQLACSKRTEEDL